MKKKYIIISIIVAVLLTLTIIFTNAKHITEKIYSNKIYTFVVYLTSKIPGYFSFSFAEIIIYLFFIFLAVMGIIFLKKLSISRNKIKTFKGIIISFLLFVVLIYFSSLFLWGFNYYREDLVKTLGYKNEEPSLKELISLCQYLTNKTNEARSKVKEANTTVMILNKTRYNTYNDYISGYESVAKKYPVYDKALAKPKPVYFSLAMSYLGISGFYFPLTGEANINDNIPDCQIPFTICHEIAHQKGFACEDAANFISYLACINNDNNDYVYSGYLNALLYSMNALYIQSSKDYSSIHKEYAKDLQIDLENINNFWNQYEGTIETISENVNDTYLKANNQSAGIKSYGKVVDLLILEFKSKP